MPSSERDLIKQAQRGDERAFTRLVKTYESLVYSFAFKVCRDKEHADETWQDTFVNVYRKLHQFDGKSKFTTWLYAIVANNCRIKRRKRKLDQASIPIESPHGFHEDPMLDDEGHVVQTIPSWKETPLDSVMDKEWKTILDKAIQKLPFDEEAGKILNLSVPAVKSRLRRARVFLRERLNPYMTP
jgi:RNA polymerase sigma-70 factor (ECF subfamily)